MKKSSPGLDGWGTEEVKALPYRAWEQLTVLLDVPNWNPFTSLLGAFRRVPIENISGFPRPSEVRPLDIFSALARVESSACTMDLEIWRYHVIHHHQHATHGGTTLATSRLLLYTEQVLRQDGPLWAMSLDFSRLYNMVSPVL